MIAGARTPGPYCPHPLATPGGSGATCRVPSGNRRTSRSQVTSPAWNTMSRTVCACQPLCSEPSGTSSRGILAPRRCRFGPRRRGLPAVLSRSAGAGRRRFPAHRFGQPGRLRLRASRQLPGSLIPACSYRPGSVRSASRLSRSRVGRPSHQVGRQGRRDGHPFRQAPAEGPGFPKSTPHGRIRPGHPYPERPFHRHPVNRRPTCPPTRKPKTVSGHAATVVFSALPVPDDSEWTGETHMPGVVSKMLEPREVAPITCRFGTACAPDVPVLANLIRRHAAA